VDDEDRVLTVQFTWNGEVKPVTTLFIGTSPEFELALYTLCFVAGREANHVVIDRYRLNIRCHPYRTRDGVMIGSSFPELISEDE
jgi:poly(U)-specific endoribonuclease